jgi:RNA polymerase sigma factor (sigma-70 family)
LSTPPVEEHLFRREYARLVATLARRFGMRHLDAIEDAAQSALLSALETWTTRGIPENPSAWLLRVAHNELLEDLRRRARRERLVAQHARGGTGEAPEKEERALLGGDVRDDLLRMMFACCDDSIPIESQLVLALKTLSGFDVREIAERLFTTEANVYKRLARARSTLRDLRFEPGALTPELLRARLPAVQSILYLMFTEGYLSSHAQFAIRGEVCDEAKRLTEIVAEHSLTATPETFALLALMHLHAARMSARQDAFGGLLLLDEQDRSLWNATEIQIGLSWLARSASGDVFSRYHAEAGIAAEHCLSPSFAQTRWDRIVEGYTLLERVAPSALSTLNRALAIAEWKGAEEGLAVLGGLVPPSWLEGSYQWAAVLADLHRRCGHDEAATRYREAALASAPSAAIREALRRRLQMAAR